MRLRLKALLTVVGVLVTGQLIAQPAHADNGPIDGGGTCYDYRIIGVRGSGQAYEGPWQMGLTVGPAAAIVGAYLSEFGVAPEQISEYSLRYPAVDVFPNVLPWDSDYWDSVETGVQNLVVELNNMAFYCPNTKTVLIGFSQGAQVVHTTLDRDLSFNAKRHVAGIFLIADPIGRLDYPYAHFLDASGNDLGQIARGGALDAQPINNEFWGQAVAICLQFDIVCSKQGSSGPHGLYPSTGNVLEHFGGIVAALASPSPCYCSPGGGGSASLTDGTVIYHPGSGSIDVMAGGARMHVATFQELNEAGYGNAPRVTVSDAEFAALPTVPRDGTVVRNAVTGAIDVVVGGARMHFASFQEITDAGYGSAPRTNVPAGAFNALPTIPRDRTVVRNAASGDISLIVGGARMHFASFQEIETAGYGNSPRINVPAGAFNTLSTVPRDGTVIRDEVSGNISLVVGGGRMHFATFHEIDEAGYGNSPRTNVPSGAFNALPTTPRDGTVVRSAATGNISVMAGGARMWVTSFDELTAAGYGSAPRINVPAGAFNALPTVPRDGTLVRAPGTAVYRITLGKRAVEASPPSSATMITASALAGIPVA